MKTLSGKVIAIFLCFNLLVNSFLPLVIYAREAEDAGGSYDAETPPADTVPADQPQEAPLSPENPNEIRQEQRDIRQGHESNQYAPGPAPETTPAPVSPQDDVNTQRQQQREMERENPGNSYVPGPPPETTPEPAPAEIVTTPTAQQRAMDRYARRAEALDKYQDEVMANTRADESTSGNQVTYLPSKITGMVQNQLNRVEEELNKIAESAVPKTREEILRDRRIEQKEEQLNKIAEQQDATIKAEQQRQRDAIIAVQNMPADQRAAYLKDQGVIPQDIPTDQVDARIRAAAVKSGLLIDGDVTSGDFTISVGSTTISAADVANAGKAVGEFGLDTFTQGAYSLGKSALSLQGDMDKVDRLLGEAGLVNRQQLSPISGPGSLAGGYAVTLIRLQELKNDVDAHPDSTLTPEQQAKRKEYAEALRTLWEEQHQVALDTAAAAAMTFVGAPLKLARAGAAKVIPQSVQKAAGEAGSSAWSWVTSKAGGIFGKGAKEGESVVEEAVGDEVLMKVDQGLVSDFPTRPEQINFKGDLDSIVKARGINIREIEEASRIPGTDLIDIDIYEELLKRSLLEDPKVTSIVSQAFSKDSLEHRRAVVDALAAGVDEEIILARAKQARELADRMNPKGLMRRIYPEARENWNILRYEGEATTPDEAQVLLSSSNNDFADSALKTLIDHDTTSRNPDLQALVDYANSKLKESEAYIVGNLQGTPFEVQDSAFRVHPDKVSVVSTGTMRAIGKEDQVDGFYDVGGRRIVIRDRFIGTGDEENARLVMLHECLHYCDFVVGGVPQKSTLAKAIGVENSRKLDEGITELLTQSFSNNSALVTALKSGENLGKLAEENQAIRETFLVYKPQVTAVHDQIIPKIMELSDLSREQANAVVMAAVRNGQWENLVKAVGGEEALKKILDGVPLVTEQIVTESSRVVTPLDKGGAILAAANEVKAASSGSTKLLPWRLIGDVYAQETNKENIKAADTATFELLVKKELIKEALEEDGSVKSDFVKDVVNKDIIQPEVLKLNSGYLLTTGKAGTVEGDVNKSKYLVDISSIPNLDIKVPSYIDLSLGDATIGIAIKEGSGKVEKVGSAGGRDDSYFSLAKKAYAQEASNSTKVKVVVFKDTNGNGVIDNEEKALPWAGVSVKLTKVNQENTVNLNAGWNLVSLTLLPNQTLTAAGLLKAITDQKGQAIAVSTLADGAWKSYVIRDNKDYSTNDFPIEVGKSYFVKALKPSAFKFSGQNLVSPVKLSLKTGWNAVGLPKTSKTYQASSLIDTLTNQASGSGTLAWWDSGLWDTFVKKSGEEYGNNFAISPNFGYIIKVEQAGEVMP